MRIGCTQTGRSCCRHAPEHRPKFRRRQRLARDIGEHLHAARAEALHRAVGLRDRGLDVVHRQRGDEGRKSIGILAANLGQRIVGHAHQLRRLVRRRRSARAADWRATARAACRRTRSSSARRASTSHSVLSRGNAVSTGWPGNEVAEPIEIGLRHEVVEDVDHHWTLAVRIVAERAATLDRGGGARQGGTINAPQGTARSRRGSAQALSMLAMWPAPSIIT